MNDVCSVIMSTFNRTNLLNLSLKIISSQPCQLKKEIVIVNDGLENDGVLESIKKYKDFLDIKYTFTGQRNCNGLIPRNPCIPNNIGIKQATGDIVILTNPEIYHLNNAIYTSLDPVINDCSCYTIPNCMLFDNIGHFTNALLNNQKLILYNNMQLNFSDVEMPFFLCIKKSVLLEIGGYDEDFKEGVCAEDNDLIDRINLKGLRCIKTGSMVVHLFHGDRYGNIGECRKNPLWRKNYGIYTSKKGIIIRNQSRKWGVV